MPKIPPSIIGSISPVLATKYTHDILNSLFMASDFPGDPPEGSKLKKCQEWLRRANKESIDPLRIFGALIAELMDAEPLDPKNSWADDQQKEWEVVHSVLAREGLSYQRGGYIFGKNLAGPSRSLAERLEGEGIEALDQEYRRAYASIVSDPPAAVTAACALLESVCKTFLEAEGHPLPAKQVLGSLWAEVAKHLRLQPGQIADDDLRRILQGLNGIADGVAAIRTHEGSAHGRSGHEIESKRRYKLLPRHARLAVHAAHTMAMFVLETWEDRKQKGLVGRKQDYA
jgi:Abortive infection C-terminus